MSTDSLVQQLRTQIRQEVIAELGSMTLNQLVALASGGETGNGKRPFGQKVNAPIGAIKKRGRRSAVDVKTTAIKIGALLADHTDGLKSEQIQKLLGLPKPVVAKAAAYGINEGTLSKTGERRGTTYFAKTLGGNGRSGGDGTNNGKRGRKAG